MKLTARQTADLKVMALEGVKNANIALALGLSVDDVHAARSKLGYTREKASGILTVECPCCGAPAPIDIDNLYTLPDGVDRYLCERCKLTVDYVNSFDEEDKAEDERQEDSYEEYDEPEDEDEL